MGSGSPTTFGSTPSAPSSFQAPAQTGFSAPSAPSSFGGGGFGGAPTTGFAQAPAAKPMPAVGKPANIGSVDSDYMPPRD